MRYVIYGAGAGAVGGAIGGLLAEHGREVVLVARGPHLSALQTSGLELRSGDEVRSVRVPAVGGPAEVGIEAGDVVVLAMKSQDSEAAIAALAAVSPKGVAVVCAQNGVENERLALRRFERVYGVCVLLPASQPAPGVAQLAPGLPAGVLDIGRYPAGVDPLAEAIAGDLRESGFLSRAEASIMDRKYRKLVSNLRNALEAVCGPEQADPRWHELLRDARAEAMACFEAAGIEVASEEDDAARRGELRLAERVARVAGRSSSWQSLARATGSIESDWLNGEVVLLGRLHGVATPVNVTLQRATNELARQRQPPGSLTLDALLERG